MANEEINEFNELMIGGAFNPITLKALPGRIYLSDEEVLEDWLDGCDFLDPWGRYVDKDDAHNEHLLVTLEYHLEIELRRVKV